MKPTDARPLLERIRAGPYGFVLIALIMVLYELPKLVLFLLVTYWYENVSLSKTEFGFPSLRAKESDVKPRSGHPMLEHWLLLTSHALTSFLFCGLLILREWGVIAVAKHSELLQKAHLVTIAVAWVAIPETHYALAVLYMCWVAALHKAAMACEWVWYVRLLHVHSAIKIARVGVSVCRMLFT